MVDQSLQLEQPGQPALLAAKRSGAWARVAKTWAPVLPFAGWMLLFLGIPAAAIAVAAFEKDNGGFTMANINSATSGVYLDGFENSLKMAAVTAVVPAIAGGFLAYAIHTSKRPTLRRLTITASGVFSQFGGIPLAFLFIATIGAPTALLSGWLHNVGVSAPNLYTFTGVALVYMYFQVPLMVLVILPAFEGLRTAWHEAAEGLGARSAQYWRYVGIPVLLPSLLGATLLLFGSALSAYATADALTAGTLALTPIQIGTFLNGNVIAGQEHVGYALALGLVVIIVVVMSLYVLLQRRASRWLR
ncbi:MAG TPA: ABC transporter permease subunit [Acidimicrobiales bacterium]|nr:ABC transporter permease subunit [Acidimicrobiales bacterium]